MFTALTVAHRCRSVTPRKVPGPMLSQTSVLEGGSWPRGSSASPRGRISVLLGQLWLDKERNFLATSWHRAWEAPRAQQVVYGKQHPVLWAGNDPAHPSPPPRRPWRPL